jgi:ribose 1,5-bisphosphokinase PhnN
MIAMTGHNAKSGAESSDPVTKAEFMQLAREGLNTFTA